MISRIWRKIWNPLTFVVTRLYGRSLDGVTLSLIICVPLLAGTWVYYQRFITLIHFPLFLLFLIDISYILMVVRWHFSVGKKAEVVGYLRLDNTIELHIAGMDSQNVFERRIRKTIRYAQKNNHFIEYTSGIIPYGELFRRFGDAIVMVKAPGLLTQIINGSLAASVIKGKAAYNLAHPLKVVLDPSKLGSKNRSIKL